MQILIHVLNIWSYRLVPFHGIQVDKGAGIMIINITKGRCSLSQTKEPNNYSGPCLTLFVSHKFHIPSILNGILHSEGGLGHYIIWPLAKPPQPRKARLTQGASYGIQGEQRSTPFMMFHCTDGFIQLMAEILRSPVEVGSWNPHYL